ncbi:hypothetical protein SEP9_089 [Staphylococcus phage vB_SepS_SEP9]|uniref:Uncharacterized protein n=1 Tax=Staphylococcus phage vB_SepS_SEP9 TaxID=1434319 RepID=W5RVC8_9CAUD|nr:hypothetical protein SEP9_089 [Staphylococcus phage vB_SepS_SEP9]AHG24010.1 hypothetical protein SEP9_089 [Staphylococcus phage vB_SepS_SEP9]
MTKIKVEEVISHGEYLKKLIDEQGAENFFVEQIAYSNDKSFLKIVNFETKDNVTYADNGEDLIIQKEIEINEHTILENIIVKHFNPYSSTTMIDYYKNVNISHLVNETPLKIKEVYYLDDAMNTQLIWKNGEMV